MISHFQPVYPQQPFLKEHVYCYYTVNSTSADFLSRHYSFPHTYNALSIYKGVQVNFSAGSQQITGDGTDGLTAVLQGKRQRPLLVEMAGAFSRITILFKPLGLNHFINQPLDNLMGSEPKLFDQWNLSQDLFPADLALQVERLEALLGHYYRPFKEPALPIALNLLEDFNAEHPMEIIAAQVGLPLRTFNRLFRQHLGVSPVTHRRIARFRHSLENKLFHQQFQSLTAIGYQSRFYDQSYFIKLYNQLAGANPGALFNKLSRLGDSKLVFEFKDDLG